MTRNGDRGSAIGTGAPGMGLRRPLAEHAPRFAQRVDLCWLADSQASWRRGISFRAPTGGVVGLPGFGAAAVAGEWWAERGAATALG